MQKYISHIVAKIAFGQDNKKLQKTYDKEVKRRDKTKKHRIGAKKNKKIR